MLSPSDIRKNFLSYFNNTGHEVVPSSSLVPFQDPTLMFVNSGMVQFKNLFLGLEKRNYSTATTAQKCVRAGGKHNDLDNVGYTARHHSFFEMLGNFSFGDYFKEQAIYHAWQVVGKELKLPKEKLFITIYHDDEEAYQWWRKIAGFGDDKIIRITTSDNFWQMGDVGPCGPCTEIFYDHGDKVAGGPPGSADADGDRFVEIWNLVFMQYEMMQNGERIDLPRASVDTGMGLERISAVMAGVENNFDTPLFQPIIQSIADILEKEPDDKNIASFRVMADHLRAMVFLIADGVIPSNEGRGYVLRRIMRRGMRHAYLLGARQPVFHRLLPTLITIMGGHYQELMLKQDYISNHLLREESSFQELLWAGIKLLEKATSNLPQGKDLAGDVAFQLYDTHGFPLDLTIDILKGEGRGVEVAGFDTAMEQQRKRARETWVGSGDKVEDALWFQLKEKWGATEFLGYDTLSAEGKVLALIKNNQDVQELKKGEEGWVVLNQTPFYGESGGQKGDIGILSLATKQIVAKISDCKKYQSIIAHKVMAEENIKIDDKVIATVDENWRSGMTQHHSATHLLHEALRQYLGDHVAQRGALVANDYLRFDFSHHVPLTHDDMVALELAVNQKIMAGGKVMTRSMGKDEAIKFGAIALFGEKYGEEVRVVMMGQADNVDGNKRGDNKTPEGRKDFYSVELCGGTHVDDIANIEAFVLKSQEAIASGVRRVVAVSGKKLVMEVLSTESEEWRKKIIDLGGKVTPPTNTNDISVMKNYIHDLKKQHQEQQTKAKKQDKETQDKKIATLAEKLASEGKNGILITKISGDADITGKDIKSVIDIIKKKPDFTDGLVVVALTLDDSLSVGIASMGKMKEKYHAKMLAEKVSNLIKGRGGGNQDFAMVGSSEIKLVDDMFASIKKEIG